MKVVFRGKKKEKEKRMKVVVLIRTKKRNKTNRACEKGYKVSEEWRPPGERK